MCIRDRLKGEKILYVKIDGSTGAVQKVNNKYLGKQASIKNTKNLSYGYYLMRFDVKKVVTKKGFTTIEGKIKGYKESKLNNFRRYILNIFDNLFMTEENLYAFSRAAVLGEKSEVDVYKRQIYSSCNISWNWFRSNTILNYN